MRWILICAVLLLAGCVGRGPLPDAGSESAKLYKEKCGRCHGVRHPVRYSADRWKRVVEHMSDWQMMHLSAEDKDKIVHYLQRHAKSVD